MKFNTFPCAITLLLLLQTSSATPLADTIYDVAIIGGGSGGIHAAIKLKDAGAKVVVIEQKSQIGGHAETYYVPETNKLVNTGVRIFIDTEIVNNYFARLKVPMSRITLAEYAELYDFTLGIPIPQPSDTEAAAQQQAIQDALLNWSQNVLSKYTWVDQGYLLPNPVPEELTLPFEQFAEKYNCTALIPVIAGIAWYAGDITKIPALYAIKDFGPGLLRSFTGELVVPSSGDTRSLYEAAAKELAQDTFLNATITSVTRRITKSSKEGWGVSIDINQPNQASKAIRARKLLIAIPPVLESVGNFDLSSTECALFTGFSAVGYFSGLVKVPGLDVSLQNVGALTPYNLPLIPASNIYYAQPNLPEGFTFNIAFDDWKGHSISDAEAVVHRELNTLANAGAFPVQGAENAEILFASNHSPYNVRVSGKDIREGFYEKLLDLEGERNTYWTGAAFAGQNSGLVWAWNEGSIVPALKRDLGL